jgi:hypothetical protein
MTLGFQIPFSLCPFPFFFACSAPSAVKASALQGEEIGGIACVTHSKQRGARFDRPARNLVQMACVVEIRNYPVSEYIVFDKK